MNNIAAGAVLLPAAVRVSRQTGVPASKILIQLSFGTLLGGMATLFTTANIILSGNLVAQGQRGLTMGDFLLCGGSLVLTGMAYMLLLGRRLLPARESVGHTAVPEVDLRTTYQLHFRAKFGLTAVALWREGRSYRTDVADFPLEAGDALLMTGPAARVC